jgi:hypothetical protein
VKLEELDNEETVSLITDVIGNFLDVQLDAANFNDPPALIPMSGIVDPVTIDTRIDEAFDLEPFVIGSIKRFANINSGSNYINRVFAVALDPIMSNFDVYNQIITLDNISATFEVGSIITQNGISGKILRITGNTIFVLPYSYYGFEKAPITFGGKTYNPISISRDYSSKKIGFKGNKAFLPSKVCQVCGKEMTWRKSWAKNWEEVKYCSDTCRAKKSTTSTAEVKL